MLCPLHWRGWQYCYRAQRELADIHCVDPVRRLFGRCLG
ncbi:Uncharacterised protein [Vibrio cholerae]|nr:Uncharacterised protein [Vibrio cholerae]